MLKKAWNKYPKVAVITLPAFTISVICLLLFTIRIERRSNENDLDTTLNNCTSYSSTSVATTTPKHVPTDVQLFPLRKSPDPNARYLVDANNDPFFINGATPWSLIGQVSKEDAERYELYILKETKDGCWCLNLKNYYL